MPEITRITRRDLPARTSGTVLSEVRRPSRGIVGIDVAVPAKGDVKTEKVAPEPKATPLPKGKTPKPESNDADARPSDG